MDTYVQLANLHERGGDLQAAEHALTMGIQHEPTWAPGYLWRGKIYEKQEKSGMAETDFRRAIQLAPDVPFPKEALASLLATENRALAEALTLAEIAVKSARINRHTVPHLLSSITVSTAFPMPDVKLKLLLPKPLNTPIF